jgi:hypothetical protein
MLRLSRRAPARLSLLATVLAAATAEAQSSEDRPPYRGGGAESADSAEAEADGLLDRARNMCARGEPCPLFRDLARRAQRPNLEAIRLLGQIADPRASGVLLQLAAYGSTEAVRRGAELALASMSETKSGSAAVRRHRDAEDPDVRALADRYGAVASVERKDEDDDARASEPSRLVFGSSAVPREAGTGAWTSFNLGVHGFEHALTDNLELGFTTVLPIGLYAAIPSVKLTFPLGDRVHFGVTASGGVAGVYAGDGGGGAAGVVGGPIVSVGDERLAFTGAVDVFAGETYATGGDEVGSWGVLPRVGVSSRLSKLVRLNLEVVSPLGPEFDNGRNWGVLYGVRLFGDELFGDINFFIPVFDGAEDILKYAPLGLPLLSFGYNW